MTPGIIRSLKTQVPALAIAVVALAHTAANVLAGQEPLRDRAITHGYGLSNVTVLGQVVPPEVGIPCHQKSGSFFVACSGMNSVNSSKANAGSTLPMFLARDWS